MSKKKIEESQIEESPVVIVVDQSEDKMINIENRPVERIKETAQVTQTSEMTPKETAPTTLT